MSSKVEKIFGGHHAVVYIADPKAFVSEIHSEEAVTIDQHVELFDSFALSDARRLRQAASQKGMEARQQFIIGAYLFTEEAQNALLKMMEESGARFLVVTPRAELLLETVLSRVLVVSGEGTNDLAAARTFLRSSPKERLLLIEPLADKKNESPRHMRAEGRKLLGDIERVLIQSGSKDPEVLGDLWRAKHYIEDSSSQPRMLLEHIAAALPVLP